MKVKHNTPDITLEQYILGELPKSQMKELEREIKADTGLRKRIDRIADSNKDILTAYPPSFVKNRIETRVPRRFVKKSMRFNRTILLPVFGAAAALAVILFAFPINVHHPVSSNGNLSRNETIFDTIRFKGDDSKLYIFRKTETEPELLTNGSVVHEGDIIQIVYQTQKQYGVIFSIDGKGNITLHYPNSPSDSSKTENGKKVYLQKSYQLDSAPVFERFFFVYADIGLSPDYILIKAKSFAKDPERAENEPLKIAGTKVVSVLLRKE
jgi:hypothetical protein